MGYFLIKNFEICRFLGARKILKFLIFGKFGKTFSNFFFIDNNSLKSFRTRPGTRVRVQIDASDDFLLGPVLSRESVF